MWTSGNFEGAHLERKVARREKIQANFGATRKGRSPQESAGTLVGVREDEKNDQLQKQLVIDIGGVLATGDKPRMNC